MENTNRIPGKSLRKILILILLGQFISTLIFSQEILIHKRDATVWAQEQIIYGELNEFQNDSGNLFLNGEPISFNISSVNNSFEVPIKVGEGENTIIIEVDNQGSTIISDTLLLTLGYNVRPEVFAYANIEGSDMSLHVRILENPDSSSLDYLWSADQNNPSSSVLFNPTDTSTGFQILELMDGEFYYDLRVISSDGDTVKARTFITIKDGVAKAFNYKTDYASWIDSAIIYEITPYIFVQNGKFKNITDKIPEIVRLGINTIWIQPIQKTRYGGQGYDITGYFEVRSDLGTEEELGELVSVAKEHGLKVLFDFVPNHSSVHHPYANDTKLHGTDSHYWDFYQREYDNVPYSQHYSRSGNFINYFWDIMANLNFYNPEVKKWISEAIRYWVEKYDIDGYRFDAVWGVNARNPEFMKDVRFILKRLKPEILMLAEDKATWPETFDENFDLAFDWFPEQSWVSHWTWQTNYSTSSNPTIFNNWNENARGDLLRDAITNNGEGYAPNAKILRFMGNNDIYHFIYHHDEERTRMAASLLFTLHGVPLIYNGQEVGRGGHPYSTNQIFTPNDPLDKLDSKNFFPFYQRLIEIRKSYPALISHNYMEVSVNPDNYTFGFRRWNEDQNIFTILNMKSDANTVTVSLPVDELEMDSTKQFYLTDLFSGDFISGTISELSEFNMNMERYSAKILLLADSVEHVTGVNNDLANETLPKSFRMSQNYPNPFNSSTNIQFRVPSSGDVVLKIFDVLGREIITLVDEFKIAGIHKLNYKSNNLPSGVYFYKLKFKHSSLTRKMILLK